MQFGTIRMEDECLRVPNGSAREIESLKNLGVFAMNHHRFSPPSNGIPRSGNRTRVVLVTLGVLALSAAFVPAWSAERSRIPVQHDTGFGILASRLGAILDSNLLTG